MKKMVREYTFPKEQLNTIRSLARELNLTEITAKLLVARGIDSAEKIQTFLRPGKENFLSPFLMHGMKEAVDLIKQAKEEGWNVAVFGDYDADGVCASSIMHYALSTFGIDAKIYIPERADGYGLSVSSVDKIFEEFFPDLLITVDCGISNSKEVEYIKEQGTYVIVTDHHELPETLPDCICVNPKIKDDYPYDNLCGAGVAFKLACALIGEKAYDLLDFAALATVADSVPLLGENRDIVSEGLKKIQTSPRAAFTALLGRNYEEITAQTLAFTIAPRINAAGRMGDAACALELFLCEDEKTVYDLAVKLNAYNMQRQHSCDKLYESAKKKIREKGAYGNIIMLWDEDWSSGFVGIVAARISEEYCRPTILFVKNGSNMKGSARSIESVNIFDALKNCAEFISEFGGHAQAAGVNITEENFDALEQALNRYIGANYTEEDFQPKLVVSEVITEPFSVKLAHELNALEPYGVGHRKPLFCVTAKESAVRPVKSRSPHISIKNPYIDLMFFNGEKYTKLIESAVRKQFIFECNCSTFRGKEYVKGFVRDILYESEGHEIPVWRFANDLKRLQADVPSPAGLEFLTAEQTERLIAERRQTCAYGLCVITSDPGKLTSFSSLRGIKPDVIYLSARNVANALIVSPAEDTDLSDYREIVFLERPTDFNLTGLHGKPCYVNSESDICGDVLKLDTTRETLLKIFGVLRANATNLPGGGPEETAVLSDGLGFSVQECIFALSVFEELGLIAYENESLIVYRGVHADLNDSKLYKKVTALQSKE